MAIITIQGKTLGTCVINEFLVLFTHETGVDRIYKVSQPDSVSAISQTIKLFEGNLGFDYNHPIQTLPFYENDSIQKVYWIDGLNQPRVINIADESYNDMNSTQFDFIQSLELNESAFIEKLYTTGYFKSGVIQYAATYFNKNGAESNIFWISDINYISLNDRAGKPDEIIQNAFKVIISNLEGKYEYIRLYSIYRTSLDTTPEVKIVTDLKIPSSKSIAYIDAGNSGSIVDTTLLLYVGGEELIPQCMSQKNNTLFLGNISLPNNDVLPATLKTNGEVFATGVPAHASTFEWTTKSTILEDLNSGSSMYPYKPFISNIKHFKFDETYRFGIQGQFSNGKWSTPIWLGDDFKVPNRYSTKYTGDNTQIQLDYINGKYNVASELSKWFISVGFIKVRPVMVPLSYSDRTIIAQGLVNNTLGIVKNRHSGRGSYPFSYPDYRFRNGGVAKTASSNNPNGLYTHLDLLAINSLDGKTVANESNPYIEIMGNCGEYDLHDLSQLTSSADDDLFFVDKNIVNFWSPDLINNSDQLNTYVRNVTSVGLYGFSFQSAMLSDWDIDYSRINEDSYSNTTGFYPKIVNNYDNASSIDIYMDQYKAKRLFPLLVSEENDTASKIYKAYSTIPVWSPEYYKIVLGRRASNCQTEAAVIDFTIFNKSAFNYYGVNRTLKPSFINYKYDINNPALVINDSNIYYESNPVDNTDNNGNILYSKNVDKVYPSDSYFNTIKYYPGEDTVPTEDRVGLKYTGNLSSWGSDDTTHPAEQGMYVRYNTPIHALFSFKEKNSKFACMPRLLNLGESFSLTYEDFNSPAFYRQTGNGFRLDVISRSNLNDTMLGYDYTTKNSLPIFDLYKTVDDSVRYGGKTSQALYNNTWIPCGNAVAVTDSAMTIEYTIGDTYIGRFDMLRVFPNDINQIVQHTEIVSFICESFVNPDGRSDVNRYNTDSSLMTPTNYGLFNSVYSQKDNYFTYNILDPDLFNTTNYSNTVVWSRTKVSGEKIDTWTNINMLSSIDLDGVYGEISSINLFNNELYAFQPNGIARLLFNERIQQQSSDGVSVELANGYKVPEYRYLTNQYGSSNKWSIVEGKGGIYFVDYKNKSFNVLADGVKDLSSTAGFKSWFNENTTGKDYILSYDKINNDVYIHDETNCLNYSETLNSFVSFYDYVDILQMKNVWDGFISIKDTSNIQQEILQLYDEALALSEDGDNLFLSEQSTNSATSIWINNAGEYNKFYGVNKPFSIEYLFSPEPQHDKVFNTFEYRLDNQSIDWTDLSLNNWYQTAALNENQYVNSLKRKFSVNRVVLPRQTDSMNRIRSTWMKMKLQNTPKTTNNNNKFEMQDLTITYTI